jgi:hypothetical protein
MTTNIVTFNTGRMYSDKGQRIACALLADGRVMFADVDRNIGGTTQGAISPGQRDLQTADSLERFVMTAYDFGAISYGTWQPAGQPHHDQAALERLMGELETAARAL